jgi:hypothetical protein
MNLVDLKRKLIGVYINSLGWKTNRKIVVIESDDWGSVRMPNKSTYDDLVKKGYNLENQPYLKYDSIETNDDFQHLYEVLKSVKNSNGINPVITANTIVTNPDFEEIKKTNFTEYKFELFTDTLGKFSQESVINLYFEGINDKLFYPQLHGREHLNISRWMNSLSNQEGVSRKMFNSGLFDLSDSQTNITENSYVDTLTPSNFKELDILGKNLIEGADIFNQVFGYRTKSFIAPCYIWRPETEIDMNNAGISIIQSGAYQLIPEIGKVNKFSKKFHYTGERNRLGQVYSVRNCIFEPSLTKSSLDPSHCLSQIDKAFNNNKPAIISSHRVNFMGSIFEKNRTENLKLFRSLLKSIVSKWPNVEFMNTAELGDLILGNDKK